MPPTFKRDILPRIQALPVKALMRVTGLTKGACAYSHPGEAVLTLDLPGDLHASSCLPLETYKEWVS
jgi:hypothetical protein